MNIKTMRRNFVGKVMAWDDPKHGIRQARITDIYAETFHLVAIERTDGYTLRLRKEQADELFTKGQWADCAIWEDMA